MSKVIYKDTLITALEQDNSDDIIICDDEETDLGTVKVENGVVGFAASDIVSLYPISVLRAIICFMERHRDYLNRHKKRR